MNPKHSIIKGSQCQVSAAGLYGSLVFFCFDAVSIF